MISEFESPHDWLRRMETSTVYLSVEHMQEGMAYAIWARNAYVGVWLPEEQGFLISRYKLHPVPYLFVECHWDIGEPIGTAKPLRPLEICPLPLRAESASRDEVKKAALCAWLDALETQYPPCPGWDSVNERRQGTAEWLRRIENKAKRDSSDHPEPIHKVQDRFP